MEPFEAKKELKSLVEKYVQRDVPTADLQRVRELSAIVEGGGGRGPVYKPDPSETQYRAGMSYEKNNNDGVVRPVENRSYRAMFHQGQNLTLNSDGFKDDIELFNVIKSGRFDPRLQALQDRAQISGTPSQGGFSVPELMAAFWLDSSLPTEIARNRAQIFPMKSESLKIPGWDAKDFSSGSYAGLKMVFLAEGASASKQTALMRQLQLTAHMGAIYVDSSLELIGDGQGFAEQLQKAMIAALGHGIDRFCIGSAGIGSGCPQSIQNAPARIGIPGETGQASSTLVYSNMKNLFARQLNPDKAIFMFNFNCLPSLLELSVSVGTGGDHIPVLNQGGDGTFSILGRPAIPTTHLPGIGNENCIMFVDWDFYAIGMRSELIFDATDSHRWLNRERSYRTLIRFDGMCTLDSEITVENGDSLSPIVGIDSI